MFTLLVYAPGAGAWRTAVSRIEGTLPMPIRCYSVGASSGAELIDSDRAWPALSETGETGAVLIRPDGHVALRVRELPDAPGDELREGIKRMLAERQATARSWACRSAFFAIAARSVPRPLPARRSDAVFTS